MPFFEPADVEQDMKQDTEQALGSYRVGAATITKISELALDGVDAALLYPDCDPEMAAEGARKLGPGSIDEQTGLLRQSVHAWLVTTPDRVILVYNVVDPAGLEAAKWGDSESLDTGDGGLAIGPPFGLSGTVTAGIVSGKGRGRH